MRLYSFSILFFVLVFNIINVYGQPTKQLIWQNPQAAEIAKGSFSTTNTELVIALTLLGITNVNPENFFVKIDMREESIEDNNAQSKFNTVPLSLKGYEFKKTITLRPGVQLIQVIYRDATGDIVAPPLRVRYLQNTKTLGDAPNLYVLSIGTETNLKYTVKDACNFANAFEKQGGNSGFLYQNVFTDMLLCKDATATNIKKTFEKIGETNAFKNGKRINPQDVLIVYLSSHGFREGNDYYIAGSDVDWEAARSTSVEYRFILERLAQLPCKKLMFIDACQSQLYQGKFPELGTALTDIHAQYKGFTVFTSSSPGQYSVESTLLMNGAFTSALVEGLKGAADAAPRGDENGQISIIELRDYLMGRVPALARDCDLKAVQNPQLIQNDFGLFEFFLSRHFPKGKDANCPITCEVSGHNLIGIKILNTNKEMDYAFSQKLADELKRQGLRARAIDGSVGYGYANVLVGMMDIVKKREIPLMPDVKTTEYQASLYIQFSGINSKGESLPCTDRPFTVLFTDDSGVAAKIQTKAQAKLLEAFRQLKPLPLCR